MDPELYKDIMDYKSKGKYPADKPMSKARKNQIRRMASRYVLEGEALYYLKGPAKAMKVKLVCGADEANALFRDFHASSTGAHTGQKKTRDAISRRFFWPGMSADIDKWVSECAVCQASQHIIKQEVEYTPIKVTHPFELIGMDLIGKLSTTMNGHQYICVMIDYLTKWPQAYPLKTKCAAEVTECIMKFVHQFEAPKRILTDQGTEFVNAINKRVCAKLGIRRSLCSPYHPQTNGLVERMNGTIQRALSKLVGKKVNTWDEYLDAVLFGLRTKKQITTKFSPYFLMFGREARYPSEVPEHYTVDSSVENVMAQEAVTEDIQRLDAIKDIVLENVQKQQERSRRKLKSGVPKPSFAVGDKVWRQNVRSQQRKGGKLEANFIGPYTITALQGKSADLLGEDGAVFLKVNVDDLKIVRVEMPRVPHKMKTTKPILPAKSSVSTNSVLPSRPSVIAFAKFVNPAMPAPTPAPEPAPEIEPAPSPAPTPTTAPSPEQAPKPAPSLAPETTPSPVSTPTPAPSPEQAPEPAPASAAEPAATASMRTSASIEKYVREAWTKKDIHILFSKIGPYKLYSWDIARISPDHELESEAINAYLTVMVRDYNRSHVKKAGVIDSFAMTAVWEGRLTRLARIDPMAYVIIVGIVNQRHHWMSTVMYPHEKRCLFLDPMGESPADIKRCQEKTRAFMRKKGCNVSRWACCTLPHALQQDGTSCGVLSLKFAEKMLKGEEINTDTTREAVYNLRLDIATALIRESEDLSNLCYYCGLEEQDDTQWVISSTLQYMNGQKT